MIKKCENCMYSCVVSHGECILPTGEVIYNSYLKTYVCNNDMLFKDPNSVCKKWKHKNLLVRGYFFIKDWVKRYQNNNEVL